MFADEHDRKPGGASGLERKFPGPLGHPRAKARRERLSID
jgi:hypothetical protein